MSQEMTRPAKTEPIRPVKVEAIDNSEQVKTALGVATTVETGFSIKSREDMEQAADSARITKRGISTIENALTETFRKVKEIERLTRGQYAPMLARLKAAVGRINTERERWDRQEQRRIRDEQERAQREANAAAEAAMRAAESGAVADDDEPLAPAEVPIETTETAVRGALATSTRIRRVKAVELVDPIAAAAAWGAEVVTLDPRIAKERYDAKMKLGLLEFPPDGGAVIGGVRFVTESTFSDRARGNT